MRDEKEEKEEKEETEEKEEKGMGREEEGREADANGGRGWRRGVVG